jgi:nitrite reductase/ring-hydroxylating ferredoxin subunit
MAASERLICEAAELADGGKGVRFEVDYHGRSAPAFAVRYRGEVRAYLNRCVHVAMELDWREGEFFDQSGLYLMCATHGAMYGPENGACLGGPCKGGALVPLATTEREGRVFLIEQGKET